MTGVGPRFPVRMLSQMRRGIDAMPTGSSSAAWAPRAHTGGSGPVAAIPATLIGRPAVIACTTSSCVVLARS